METAGAAPGRAPLDGDRLRSVLLAPAGPAARVELVQRAGSTSTELVAAVQRDPTAWPDLSVLVADHQDAGRGRAGRGWQTPPGAALTFSALLRPTGVPPAALGWLSLAVGVGVVQGLRQVAGVHAVLKWPNDVLIAAASTGRASTGTADTGTAIIGWGTDRKVAGILTDLLPGPVAIVGVGLNVSQTAAELPVPTATSLCQAGAHTLDRVELLHAVLTAVAAQYRRWAGAGGDAERCGLAGDARALCATLGQRVRVELPGGTEVVGQALDLAPDGALRVQDATGRVHTVHAGDVHHVRLSP